MDNEMIERIIKASFDCWNERRGLNYTMNDLSDSEREFARMHAIAIIKAMREPTEKMKEEGGSVTNIDDYYLGDSLVKEVYQAMIDAVIND